MHFIALKLVTDSLIMRSLGQGFESAISDYLFDEVKFQNLSDICKYPSDKCPTFIKFEQITCLRLKALLMWWHSERARTIQGDRFMSCIRRIVVFFTIQMLEVHR